MLYLIGSIVLTSYLTLALKLCEKYAVSIFQAIDFNYITYVITGSIVNRSFPINREAIHQTWFQWAINWLVISLSIIAIYFIAFGANL